MISRMRSICLGVICQQDNTRMNNKARSLVVFGRQLAIEQNWREILEPE